MTTPTPGLDQIIERFQGAPAVAGEVSLELVLGQLSRHLGHQAHAEKRREHLWDAVHTVPIRAGALSNLVAASGVLDFPDRFGPHDGYWWDIGRLSAWGWTAGTVSVYLNDATGSGELLATFTAPGQWSWGHRQMPLAPRDRMVFVATGITGSVYVAGSATEVEAAYWPEYVI